MAAGSLAKGPKVAKGRGGAFALFASDSTPGVGGESGKVIQCPTRTAGPLIVGKPRLKYV